jgi:ATP-dependent DNA helicase RecG
MSVHYVSEVRPGDDYPERVKRLRMDMGLTQKALADRLGVSFATVNRWENRQTKPSMLCWRQLQRLEMRVSEEPATYGKEGGVPPASSDALSEHEPLPFEEKTIRRFTFDDVSEDKIRTFIREADIRIGRVSVPDFLRSLKVADQRSVKNAGILFFSKDVYEYLHQAQLTLLAFKGTERLHIYDRRDVRDDLLTQFNEAVTFLKKHLNVRSEIHGVNREDIYEIPIEVLREAVVNALMHRDYSITGTQVSIEVYDDRVEIVNPGGLPRGLSVADLGAVSIRRNELIADLFFRLHKVERVGMGIRNMKEAMVSAGLREPTFAPDTFFRAVFWRDAHRAPKHAASDSATGESGLVDGLVDGLAENQQKMLQLIGANPRISKRAMATATGISTTSIDNNLAILKSKGLLQRVGSARSGHWELVERRGKREGG